MMAVVPPKDLLSEFVGFLSACPDLHIITEQGLLRDQPELALKLVETFLEKRQRSLEAARRDAAIREAAERDAAAADDGGSVVVYDPNSPDLRAVPKRTLSGGEAPFQPGNCFHGGQLYDNKRLPLTLKSWTIRAVKLPGNADMIELDAPRAEAPLLPG